MAVDRHSPTQAVDGPTTSGINVGIGIDEEIYALWKLHGGMLQTVGGTANAITATCVPPLLESPAAMDGFECTFIPTLENTGAATIAIDGFPARNIFDADGHTIGPGDLFPGRMIKLTFVNADGSLRINFDSMFTGLEFGSAR